MSSDAAEQARVVQIRALAEKVWERPELARDFLESEHPQLGGRWPLELARSESGYRQVEALLMKIEYALPV